METLLQELSDDFFTRMDRHSPHGPWHWHRVQTYGLYLAEFSGANVQVVRLFAWFHDCKRFDEGTDPEHGMRGGARARELRPRLPLTDEELELLVEACEGHDRGRTHPNATIGTCWDADRLDLDRVLIEPKASYMSTARGKYMADLPGRLRYQLAGLDRPFRR